MRASSAADERVREGRWLPGRLTALLGALLATHVLLAWQVRQRAIFTFGDDSAYILLARSLRDLSYREMQFIGEPVAARFPPVYPALLAAWTALFGERLDAIAALGILATVLGLVALFDVVRRRWSPELGLVVLAVTAINPSVVAMAGAAASEATFTALTLGALWAADRDAEPSGSRRLSVLAGALAIAAALTRSAGVTLGAALGVHWLLRRRWRTAVLFAISFALTVGSWLAWTVVAPKREVRQSYVDDAVNVGVTGGSLAGAVAGRLANNAKVYGGQILLVELQLPITKRTTLDNVAWGAALTALGLIGLAACWYRWNAGALYVISYAGLLLVWPYTLHRFLVPVIPLAIAVVLIGAWTAGARLARRRPTVPVAAAAAVLAWFALVQDGRLVSEAVACDRARVDCASPNSLDFVAAARDAASLTPSDARFLAPKSGTLFYYGHRQSTFWEEMLAQDSASFRPYLRERGIGYVLATPVYSGYETLYRLLSQNCEYFDIVRAYSPLTMILAVRDVPRSDGRGAPTCIATARAREHPVVE